MNVINVYEQYFRAECVYNDMPRRAVIAKLQSISDEGTIEYKVILNFFPYRDEEDWAETFDAVGEKTIYQAKGRRSRRREQGFLKERFRDDCDELAAQMNGTIFWDQPMSEPRID